MLDSGEFGGPEGAFSGGPLGGLLDDRDLIGHPQFGLSGYATNTAANLPGVNLSGTQYGDSEAISRGMLAGNFNYNDLQGAIQAAIENPTQLSALMGAQVLGMPETQTFSPGMQQVVTHALSNPNLDYSMANALAQGVQQGLVDYDEALTVAQTINNINPVNPGTNINYDTDTGLVTDFTENIFNPNPNPVIDFMAQFAGPAQVVDFETNPATVPDLEPSTNIIDNSPSTNYDNTLLGVNPLSTILEVLDNIKLEEYQDNPNPAFPNVQNFINETFFSQDSNVQPSIELIDAIDITPNTNIGVNSMLDAFGIENRSATSQQEVDALMDNVLGMQSNDGMNLDYAVASTGTNPFSVFGPEFRGISPEVNFDTKAISEAGGEALQEALAQRAVENILSEQAPRQMINVTPPAPPKVAPQRRAAPKPSPIQIAAKAITRPEAVKELPKFAQESLRQGKVPTGLNSRNQDLVDRVLATPKVDIMSAGVNVKGNRALQKARSRAAQDAKN